MTRRDSTFFPCLWILLLLAAGGLPGSVYAQQSGVTVTIPEVTADSGETVTLSIEADLDGNEVDSYTNMQFTFDDSVLSIVEVRDGDDLSFGTENLELNNAPEDTLRVTNAKSDAPPVSGSGEFLEIDVKLTEEATAAFELTPSNTDPLVPISVFGRAGGGNLEIDEIDQGSVGKLSRTIPLADGWTLASVPLVTGQTFGDLFPPCQSGFLFEPGTGYVPLENEESVPLGRGFFANCSADTLQVQGVPRDSSSISVDEGWNIVGALDKTVATESVSSEPEGIVQTGFFGFDQGYQSADSLFPGQGYWVKVSQPGELDLSGQNAPSSSPPRQASSTAAGGLSPKMSLVVEDAQGRSTTLYLVHGLSASRKQGFALPPKPPSGLFDVRFANGAAAVSIGGSSQAESRVQALPDVQLQGLSFPVEVRLVGNVGEGQALRLSTRTSRTVTLTAQRRVVSLSQPTDRLQLALRNAPEAFALKKSRPHPVRRQSTIEYAVATPSDVSLNVYDALGRQVMALVEGRKRAGVHQVQLNADGLPSGTYFVRIQAGDFQQTRRLTVVR